MSDVYKRAIDHWEKNSQYLVLFEEIGELQQAVSKFVRGVATMADVAEEIADVRLMLNQLQVIVGVSDDLVNTIQQDKLARLEMRLDEEEV